jgi:hypothetical protein
MRKYWQKLMQHPFPQRHNYRNARDEHLLDTRFDY